MENHVLCYVKRSLITKWKRLVLTRDEPLFVYASNDKGLFRSRLKNGGVLWIISSIPNRPPELVARLNIFEVKNRDKLVDEVTNSDIHLSNFLQEFPYKWVAFGKEGSQFFGHNNAETALLRSAFRAKLGNPWKIDESATKWQSNFGNKFQSPRFICEEGKFENGVISSGSQPFLGLEKKKSRAIFLSWKWRDNTKKFMRELAYVLVAQGFMPWLDILAMPWSHEIGQREKEKPKLTRLLKYGYQQAATFIAIDSWNYGTATKEGKPNWTKREWDGKLADGHSVKKIIYRPQGRRPSKLLRSLNNEIPVFRHSPAEFARELRVWFDENIL